MGMGPDRVRYSHPTSGHKEGVGLGVCHKG